MRLIAGMTLLNTGRTFPSSFRRSKPDSPLFISLTSNSQTLTVGVATSQSSDGSLSSSYQTLILEAYAAIGEPDSVYGAGAGRLADVDSRIRTYMHEHTWDKALGRKTINRISFSRGVRLNL